MRKINSPSNSAMIINNLCPDGVTPIWNKSQMESSLVEERLPAWVRTSYSEFVEKLRDPAYPCFWGTLAEQKGTIRYAVVSSLTEQSVVEQAFHAIRIFLSEVNVLTWESSFEELPEEGCDWALAKGLEDREQNCQPNALCAVSISILPKYRGKNLSQYTIGYMKELTQIHSLSSLIMAARPSLKHLYPLTPIERYITWQDKNSLTFDPWLRVNIKHGAKIAGICSKSTTIIDTVAGWENRVGMRFPETGNYIIPGGLVPVKIDYANNRVTYIEPNIWLYYDLN